MPRLPDDRDRVDHVLATIDGALESYGDAMRWSPDPPEERGDWIMPEDRARERMDRIRAFNLTYTINLEEIEAMNSVWVEIAAEARAAFDRISLTMTRVGESINRLGEMLQPPSPVNPLMPDRWKVAMAAKARRGTGPTQTPWRHRNP